MKYFTSDWHFGDERMELLGRPFANAKEAQEAVLAPLRELSPTDDLYVVGDAAVDEKWLEAIKTVHCRKHLIRGNYDRLSNEVYWQYFNTVIDSTMLSLTDPTGESEPIWAHLVHYPTKSSPNCFNIVGHIHGCWKVQKNMLNVSIDAHFFRPVPVAKVFFYLRSICKFYDQDVWCANHEANVAHAERGKPGTYWELGFGGSRDNPIK
jgi:calcineurin-like phosphoesterase family protein